MPKSLTIKTPQDYILKRDACSYGYFLLWPNFWDVVTLALSRVLDVGERHVAAHVTQPRGEGSPLKVNLSHTVNAREAAEVERQLTRMLRLDEPWEVIRAFHKVDPRWKRSGRGRLFRSPTFFEDVVKTVSSCNIQWPGTIQMNRRLCEVVGEQIDLRGWRGGSPKPRSSTRRVKRAAQPRDVKAGVAFEFQAYSFPDAKTFARQSPETLRARCRVGYRDKRLVELAKLFATPKSRGGLDQDWFADTATPDDKVFAALVDLPGIGPYAAANIMQLLGRYSRLPLDTESVRHGRTFLGFEGTSAQVMKKVHAHFAPFGRHAFRSYWFEMWQFYESKHGKAWTWERETTGRLFTAALLNK